MIFNLAKTKVSELLNSAKPKSSNASGLNFENYIAKAETKTKPESKAEAKPELKTKSESKPKAKALKPAKRYESNEKLSASSESQTKASQDVETKNSTSNEKSEKINNTKAKTEVKQTAQKAENNNEEKIVENLAEILSISKEEVLSILQQLNLQASDLLDKGNISQFIQALLNIEDSSELLSIPNIKEMFNAIYTAAEQASKETAKPEHVIENTKVFDTAEAKLLLETKAENIPLDNKQATLDKQFSEEITETFAANNSSTTFEVSEGYEEVQEKDVAPVVVQKEALKAETKDEGTEKHLSSVASENLDEVAALEEEFISTTETVSYEDKQKSGKNGFEAYSSDKQSDVFIENNNFDFSTNNQSNFAQASIVEARQMASLENSRNLGSASNVDANDITKQINAMLDKMKVDVRGNLTEIKITLKPEHLGDVSLKLATQNGIVTAQFLAENERVKEIIESNFNQLKDTLQKQGIEVSGLSVSVGSESQQQRMGQFMQERNRYLTKIKQINSSVLDGASEVEIEEAQINNASEHNGALNYFA